MDSRWKDALPKPVAFVFAGGANLGAIQVGMLRTLRAAGIQPDMIVGTSVGALNGAVVAERGLADAVDILEAIWLHLRREDIFPGSFMSQALMLVRNRLNVYENSGLVKLIQNSLGVQRFEQLRLPFGVMATELITHRGVLFEQGELLPALLASTALPGVYPPVSIQDTRYIDGGVTDNVPLRAAVAMGAQSLVVLEVGNVCARTEPPHHIVDLMRSVFTTAMRQKVILEAPHIARTHPIPYLPRPCTTEIDMLNFDYSATLIEETAKMVADFLESASVPTVGEMCGGPHYHDADSCIESLASPPLVMQAATV